LSVLEFSEIDPYIAKCVRCGTCKAGRGLHEPSCPAGEYFRFEGYYSSGKIWIARGLKEGVLPWEDGGLLEKLFACTLCGNCTQQCPMTVRERIIEVFESLRSEAVERVGTPFPAHRRLKDSLIQYRNPWMQPRRRRLQWLRDLPVRILTPDGADRAEVLYFVGCTAALDPALQQVAQSTVSLLNEGDVDFGVLGEEEVCCGSVFLRIGERALVKELAEKNVEIFERLGVKTVVTSCAGCFKTLSQDYEALAQLPVRVLHASQYLLELRQAGQLRSDRETDVQVTYHDPCHLGRHCGVYEAPRQLLESLPGVELKEMKRNRGNAWCCGAGGGVRSAFPEWALQSSRARIEEAEATGSRLLVTSCPFCLQNLTTAAQAENASLQPVDLTSLLARLIL
jgi:heterodisulfide reductase subunit D